MSQKSKRKRRTWIIPAIIALAILLLNLLSGSVSKDIEAWLEPLKPFTWLALVLMAILTAFGYWYARRITVEESEIDVPDVLEEFESQRDRYLKRVFDDTQYLTLATVDFKAADASTGEKERMRLADVYIKLDTTTSVEVEKERKGLLRREEKDPMGRDTRPLPALEAVVKENRIVLLGDPGGGKTTFANHLAYCLASDALNSRSHMVRQLDAWPQTWDRLLPVPVALRELAAWMEQNKSNARKTGLLEGYLLAWLTDMGLADFYPTMRGFLRDGDAILLLDGLDEVPGDAATCGRVREMLDDLPNAYKSPMVVTCRVLSYQDPRLEIAGRTVAEL